MKKILLITLEHPPTVGGIATYCHDLALALAHDQVVVLAPAGRDRYATEEGKLAWDKEQPYKIIRKKLLWPKFIWPRWLRLVWTVWQIRKQEKIEIIFVQQVLPVGYVAVLMKKFFKVTFLLFSHGTDLLAPQRRGWKKKMVRLVSRRAEQIIFNSESLKRRYLRVLPEFGNKSLVLYPCPDPEFLEPPAPAELGRLKTQYALEGKQVLLSVSRLDEGKGFPHLINALPKILVHNPHLVWFIIGDGPKRDIITKLIRERNLQNVVRFVGEVSHPNLHPYYYLADLFVLLTHPDEGREEGLGLVFLEASAAGLPIVAGRSGGVEEAVLDGQTGLIVEATNGAQVIEAIAGLLERPADAKQLGKNARARITKDFVWGEQVAKLAPWINNTENT